MKTLIVVMITAHLVTMKNTIQFLKRVVAAVNSRGVTKKKLRLCNEFIEWYNDVQDLDADVVDMLCTMVKSDNDISIKLAQIVLCKTELIQHPHVIACIRKHLTIKFILSMIPHHMQMLSVLAAYMQDEPTMHAAVADNVLHVLMMMVVAIQTMTQDDLDIMWFPVLPPADTKDLWLHSIVDCLMYMFPHHSVSIVNSPYCSVIVGLSHRHEAFLHLSMMIASVHPDVITVINKTAYKFMSRNNYNFMIQYMKLVLSWCVALTMPEFVRLVPSVLRNVVDILALARTQVHPALFVIIHVVCVIYKLFNITDAEDQYIGSWPVLKHIVYMARADIDTFDTDYPGWQEFLPWNGNALDTCILPYTFILSGHVHASSIVCMARNILTDIQQDFLPGKRVLYRHRICGVCACQTWKACPCRTARYCGKACQRADYQQHRLTNGHQVT